MNPNSNNISDWDLRQYKNGSLLHLRVHPNSPRNSIERSGTGLLRLKLCATPVKGAANKVCIKYLSSFFNIPKSRIEIVRGARSKEKWLWFKEVNTLELAQVLESKISS